MKLIILDRDGVINHDSRSYIKSPAEWEPIDGSLEAIARLNQSGYRVVIATNQSGIGRGLFDINKLKAIHDKMYKYLESVAGRIDSVFYCPHTPYESCHCRKPKTGLFEQISKTFNLSLIGVPTIGDSLRDLQAGYAIGCKTILVLTGNGEKTLADGNLPPNTAVYENLAAAINSLLNI